MNLSLYGSSHNGRKRDHNEDAYLILCKKDEIWIEVNDLKIDLSESQGAVFVVADGLGGANAGEIASEIAVSTVKEYITNIFPLQDKTAEIQKKMTSLIHEGHHKIIKESINNNHLQGMGTTIVLGYVVKNVLYVVWCGDSRCYIYNREFHSKLEPFTVDHSLVWKKVLKKEISEEEARLSMNSNILLKCMGADFKEPSPDFKFKKLKNNDRILFCSDGLNSMLSSKEIQQILDFSSTPKSACESLIYFANNAGGLDNITIIVADVSGTGYEL